MERSKIIFWQKEVNTIELIRLTQALSDQNLYIREKIKKELKNVNNSKNYNNVRRNRLRII